MKRALVLAVWMGFGALPRVAQACAACACGDPTLTAMGAGKSFAGRLRLSGEWRRRSERRATGLGEARVREDRYTVGAAYAPVDAVQLAVTVPLVDRTLDHPTLAQDRALHVGDVELLARYFLVGARGFAAHQVGVTAGARLPTAPEVRGADGVALPVDVQPGNGSVMPSAGAWYGLFAHPWSAHVSGNLIAPFEGHAALRPGVAGLMTAQVQYQWETQVAALVGVDGRLTGRDAIAGVRVEASGGATVFATGGLGWSPVVDTLIQATLRWPVYDDRRGGERAEPSISVGVVWDR